MKKMIIRQSLSSSVAVIGITFLTMLSPALSGADVVNDLKDIGSAGVLSSTGSGGNVPSTPQTGVINTRVSATTPIVTLVQFTDSGISLAGTLYSSVAWGDYNNDGNLDLAVCGQSSSKIYKNNGNGTFTDIGAVLPATATFGAFAWGDYDNDGKLDFAISGSDYTRKKSQ